MIRRLQPIFCTAALSSLVAIISSPALAIVGQSGTLDPFWATGSPLGAGKLLTPVGVGSDFAAAALRQPDGKIVLAGYCYNGSNNDFCSVRYDGGPFGYKNCSLDLDGDGSVLATTDALIHTRIALGITGNATIGGITFDRTPRATPGR